MISLGDLAWTECQHACGDHIRRVVTIDWFPEGFAIEKYLHDPIVDRHTQDDFNVIRAFAGYGQFEFQPGSGASSGPPQMIIARPAILGEAPHGLAGSVATRFANDLHRFTLDRPRHFARLGIDR